MEDKNKSISYLDGKYNDPAIGDHVEEERHGLIFVGRVGVEYTLSHYAASSLVEHHHVYSSPLVLLSVLQDLASYTNIKSLSSQFKPQSKYTLGLNKI